MEQVEGVVLTLLQVPRQVETCVAGDSICVCELGDVNVVVVS